MHLRNFLAAASLLALAGCGTSAARVFSEAPTVGTVTRSQSELRALPAPRNRLYVSVYSFQDQTGQHKPNQNFAEYSFAVTQGGTSILINALKDVGVNSTPWFTVLERNRIGDLFQERQIIRANRTEHPGPDGKPLSPIGPLLNAGIILEGGIIGYDSNVLTGGAGATYLGIGASTQYTRDNVAVYLRAVSVLTGEVLTSITTDKTIYSVGLTGFTSKYVGFNRLLQIEAGYTTNEPGQLAVRQAIEKAVYGLVVEGAQRGYWHFEDQGRERALIDQYVALRDGTPAQDTAAAENPPGSNQQAASGQSGGNTSNASGT